MQASISNLQEAFDEEKRLYHAYLRAREEQSTHPRKVREARDKWAAAVAERAKYGDFEDVKRMLRAQYAEAGKRRRK